MNLKKTSVFPKVRKACDSSCKGRTSKKRYHCICPTDAELLYLIPVDEDDSENKEEQLPISVTLNEAKRYFITLHFYTLRTDTNDNFFAALTTIKNSLDND